jgi:hypothetical protein
MIGRRRKWLALAIVWAVGCGSPGDDAGPDFPTRDWSGPYSVEVVESSTDCAGAEAPPPLGNTVLEVRQSPDNDAVLGVGPLVSMGGRFDGDDVEARGSVVQPISLPDSLLARVSEADSLESIDYAMELSFAEDRTFTGRYVIRAPDLNALSSGSGAGRCEYVYEVRGAPLIEGAGEENGAGVLP